MSHLTSTQFRGVFLAMHDEKQNGKKDETVGNWEVNFQACSIPLYGHLILFED